MCRLKSSIIGLAVLVLLVGALAALTPLVSRVQGGSPNPPPFQPRKFYLTRTGHTGSQALSACAEDYHMASLWEIHDPTYLRYDTALGDTLEDSGFGPPALPGAIRTGGNAAATFGRPNCNVWTSDSIEDIGTLVTLDFESVSNATQVSPWRDSGSFCASPNRVWCVQD